MKKNLKENSALTFVPTDTADVSEICDFLSSSVSSSSSVSAADKSSIYNKDKNSSNRNSNYVKKIRETIWGEMNFHENSSSSTGKG